MSTPHFPHECARCGFCCTNMICPHGMKAMLLTGLIPLNNLGPCPYLTFDDHRIATCQLYDLLSGYLHEPELTKLKETFGIGSGCCVAARAIRKGHTTDFASMHPQTKQLIVLAITNQEEQTP